MEVLYSVSVPFPAPTRSGRLLTRKVFSDTVVQLVSAMKAVHLEPDDNTTRKPIAPFEAITLEQALQEDAPI